jgi:hypothetical protein
LTAVDRAEMARWVQPLQRVQQVRHREHHTTDSY